MPKNYSTVLNRVIRLGETVQYFTIIMLAEVFLYMPFIRLRKFSTIPSMLRVLNTNGCKILPDTFSSFAEMVSQYILVQLISLCMVG